MADIGRILFERPKDTGFRFGLIAMLLVSIALIFPSFYGLGYTDPQVLQFTIILIVGLVMSIMFSFMVKNASRTTIDSRVTGDAIFKQVRVLFIGVIAGLVAVAINIFTGVGMGVFTASTNEAMFMLGLLAGVSEELFFRGFIQNMIRVYVPSMIFAIIPTAVIFASFHFFAYGLNMTAWMVMFGLGVFLGLLHEIFNDIGVPMLAHVVNNVFAMLPLVIAGIMGNIVIVVFLVGVLVFSYVYATTRRR